jgi:acetyl-CoA acyltransferase
MMGIGPIVAIPKVLRIADLRQEDIGLIELNEAFAAQAIACMNTLELDPKKVNVNGGAIALGHPLGCTGAWLTIKLIHEMRRRGERYGLVSMCIGGGMGAAGVIECV